LAARDRIPTSFAGRDNVAAGGLMSYATTIAETLHQVGVYTGKILKGAKPAELPVCSRLPRPPFSWTFAWYDQKTPQSSPWPGEPQEGFFEGGDLGSLCPVWPLGDLPKAPGSSPLGAIIGAKPYTTVNWTRGIDQKTGKPLEYDPSKDIQVYAGLGNLNSNEALKKVCPSHAGGNNWWPSSYSEDQAHLHPGAVELRDRYH